MSERETIESRERMVRDVLEEHIAWLKAQGDDVGAFLDEPHDTIHDIADSAVPIYTYDLMEIAAGDTSIATDKPELGPAFDGEPTPTNIIAANIYERLSQTLFDECARLKEEYETAEATA